MPHPRLSGSPRRPKPDRRRALELLAGCGPEGCSEALMIAHGFTIEEMVELVRAGLASATAERVVAGGKKTEITAGDDHRSGAARAAPRVSTLGQTRDRLF